MTSIRVLIVDPYAPARHLLQLVLELGSDFRVIGQAGDGSEAVQKAAESLPDLILMEIDLPIMNGLQAARKIHKVSPHSKIIFVSDLSSQQIVEQVFSSGAWGFVPKSQAVRQLLCAIEAVVNGRRFRPERM